jgi:hypothetical protein
MPTVDRTRTNNTLNTTTDFYLPLIQNTQPPRISSDHLHSRMPSDVRLTRRSPCLRLPRSRGPPRTFECRSKHVSSSQNPPTINKFFTSNHVPLLERTRSPPNSPNNLKPSFTAIPRLMMEQVHGSSSQLEIITHPLSLCYLCLSPPPITIFFPFTPFYLLSNLCLIVFLFVLFHIHSINLIVGQYDTYFHSIVTALDANIFTPYTFFIPITSHSLL